MFSSVIQYHTFKCTGILFLLMRSRFWPISRCRASVSNPKNVAAVHWTAGTASDNRAGKRQARLVNGGRDECRKVMKLSPFAATERSLPDAQVEASLLKPSEREGEKTTQFMIHLGRGGEREESGEVEMEMELSVSSNARCRQNPGRRAIPVQLHQTAARKQASTNTFFSDAA